MIDVLAGRRDPSELPPLAWDLFSFGFRLGCAKSQARIDRLNAEADRLWYELRNPEEAKARHREMAKAFDVALNRKSTAEKWRELDRIAAERSAVRA